MRNYADPRTMTELGYAVKREAELAAEVCYAAQRAAQHLDALLEGWDSLSGPERRESVAEARLRLVVRT